MIAGLVSHFSFLALSGNFGTWALLRARYRSFNDRTAGGQVDSAFDGPWPGAAFLFLALSGNFDTWALFRAVDLRDRPFLLLRCASEHYSLMPSWLMYAIVLVYESEALVFGAGK